MINMRHAAKALGIVLSVLILPFVVVHLTIALAF